MYQLGTLRHSYTQTDNVPNRGGHIWHPLQSEYIGIGLLKHYTKAVLDIFLSGEHFWGHVTLIRQDGILF